MTLYAPSTGHLFTVDNFGADPSLTPGTSVVPGASNVEGGWTEVLADLAQDVYGLLLRVSSGFTAGQQKNHLLDIGVDPAGGTAYAAIISNIICGGSCALTSGIGHTFFFPYHIRAVGAVAVRIQGNNATAGTVRVGVRGYGQRGKADALPTGQYSETLGTITNSGGVAFTPGNLADGTWVSLGTTTRELWWWQLCYQVDDTTASVGETAYIELGCGASGTQKIILRRMHQMVSSTEDATEMMPTQLLWFEGYCRVPAGTEMWVRGRCDSAPDSGYNAVAVGIG